MTQEELKVKLTEWRHYLHAHPETAFEETNTAAFVAEKLREIGLLFMSILAVPAL